MVLANWRNTAPSATIFSPSFTPLVELRLGRPAARRGSPAAGRIFRARLRHKRTEDCRRCEESPTSARPARLRPDLVWITASTNMSFLSRSAGFFVTMRTGVVRVAGSSSDSDVVHRAAQGPVEGRVGQLHRVADAHRFQVAIVNMSPYPDRRHIADGEARRHAGLNHQTRSHQFLHHHAGDGRPHRQLRIDGAALISAPGRFPVA